MRSWVLRVVVASQRGEIGLGAYAGSGMGVAAARTKALAVRDDIARGIDPVMQKNEAKSRLRASQALELTCIMEALARYDIHHELRVEDDRETYSSRNRLVPWRGLIEATSLSQLEAGEVPATVDQLDGRQVSVGLWPDGPIEGLEAMTMRVDAVGAGAVRIVLFNERMTIALPFVLDFRRGRVHTQLEDGRLCETRQTRPNEADVRAYATFFFHVLGNSVAELTVATLEPVDCEVVIPLNIMLPDPTKAIEEQVERFRQQRTV